MSDLSEATLDELRAALAPRIAANAGFDGWTDAARDLAADELGADRDVARLSFPGGALDMIDAWFGHIDREMTARVPAERVTGMKVRERIAALVEARLEAIYRDRESLRRALATLALHPARAARLGWRTADLIWRAAGDTAVDYNHYTKRTILLGVYGATVTVFLDDRSDEFADTRAFLHRRIDGILRFEKFKAGMGKRAQYRPSLSRFVGRLRYPVR